MFGGAFKDEDIGEAGRGIKIGVLMGEDAVLRGDEGTERQNGAGGRNGVATYVWAS